MTTQEFAANLESLIASVRHEGLSKGEIIVLLREAIDTVLNSMVQNRTVCRPSAVITPALADLLEAATVGFRTLMIDTRKAKRTTVKALSNGSWMGRWRSNRSAYPLIRHRVSQRLPALLRPRRRSAGRPVFERPCWASSGCLRRGQKYLPAPAALLQWPVMRNPAPMPERLME
jgi:hypothetical protein